MGVLNRTEIRRLEKAAREKDKKHLLNWAIQYDNQIRIEYENAYQDELRHSINSFLTAVAYTAHFSEEINLGKDRLPAFMNDLFVTVDMFRTGEYNPDDYKEELEKNGVYPELYDYNVKTKKIITIVGMFEDLELIYSQEKTLTQSGNMVFINIMYQVLSDDMLDTYRNKIRISDEVHIINNSRDIPEVLQKEIDYARSKRKPVSYMREDEFFEED